MGNGYHALCNRARRTVLWGVMNNDIVSTLKALFDTGGVVVVTAMLWVVWQRLNKVTDRIIDIELELRLKELNSAPPGTSELDET